MDTESGEAPLLQVSSSNSHYKPFNWKAPAIILAFEFLESIAYSGIALNLVVYLGKVLHGTTASSAANVDTWNGTTFLTPVLGAFLADTYWGKYKTVAISIIFYLTGLLIITASAIIPSLRPASCEGTSCPPATGFQYFVFFASLYLVSVGTGGVKSALLPFGADQYDDSNIEQSKKKQAFFSLFFIAINLGVFISGTVVVWIQQNVAWSLGFSISSICLIVATIAFLVGTPIYRVQLPTGSPLKSLIAVFVASFKKRKVEVPADTTILFEGDHADLSNPGPNKLVHTDGFRCLDKAAVVLGDQEIKDSNSGRPWLLCTVTQVEEVKILLRMLPIWATSVFYAASMCQTATTFVQQGNAMNTKIGSFSVPAASLNSAAVVFMMIWVVFQDSIVIPIARRYTGNAAGLTQLQRMGVGRFLAIPALAVAALLEMSRLRSVRAGHNLSIAWQLPQFVILSCSDVFCGIAQLEFFYSEAPVSMRSLCSAFSFLAMSLGYYLNSMIISAIAVLSKSKGGQGWLPADLNDGHLDYYFWLWTGISAVNFVVYTGFAKNYTVLTQSTGGPSGPNTPSFIRAEVLPSGYLIRPCEGGGSMIHIVDHVDLDAWSVPEVLRPLYESPKILAQKTTIAALRHIRQIAHESSGEIPYGAGRQPAVLRTFSQRLSRGFNDAVSGFPDDGWSLLSSDGSEDITITVNSSPNKLAGSHVSPSPLFSAIGGGILCAKASMLLQNVPPALLVRFLREHRSEWADPGVDAYSAASLRASPYAVPGLRAGGFMGSQVILPLAHTLEHEEFLEVLRLEGHGFSHDEVLLARDMYLLQLCSGVDENAAGACAQLVFAPIDESFADDAPLLPSGFRVIPLDTKADVPSATRTLDLASALEVGSGGALRGSSDASGTCNTRSVLTIAFQFSFENHLRESVAAMARQYVRAVMASVQRVAMAIAPSRLGSQIELKHPPGSPEALTLASWIGKSYSAHTGAEIRWSNTEDADSPLMLLWNHSDAILCCSLKAAPMFTFGNNAALDMLETTLVNLQDISLEAILDDEGRKALCADFSKIMQQGFAYLPAGVCKSSMGRQASYEQAVAWKVLSDDVAGAPHCLAFMFVNWTFL